MTWRWGQGSLHHDDGNGCIGSIRSGDVTLRATEQKPSLQVASWTTATAPQPMPGRRRLMAAYPPTSSPVRRLVPLPASRLTHSVLTPDGVSNSFAPNTTSCLGYDRKKQLE